MLVETFEQTEVDHEGQPECEPEAVALIEKLGLEGQQKLVKRDESGESKRTPYRKMTKEEMFVYRQLCPKVSKLKSYADGPIPLRVLQVAAHAHHLFDEVEVWSAQDSDVKDPVLVGINRSPGQFGGTDYSHFLLARWGDELEAFPVCLAKAIEKFRAAYKSKASQIIAQMQAAIVNIDGVAGDLLYETSLPYGYA